MPETFGDCWRRVRLHVPAAPTFLAREWVNAAWKPLGRMRHWAFLQGELRLTIAAERALSAVTVTNGSTTVTSAGLFLAADAGRQFRVTSFPIYTIQTFTDANTIVLDTAYGEDDATAAAAIFDGYAVMPADFESFRLVADPYNQRRLAFWISADQLNIMDPTRQASDSGPRLLSPVSPSPPSPPSPPASPPAPPPPPTTPSAAPPISSARSRPCSSSPSPSSSALRASPRARRMKSSSLTRGSRARRALS